MESFLVGAFSLKEKSPTIKVGSFFSVDNLTLNSPLFLQSLFICSTNFFEKQEIVGSILALNHKFFYAFKSRCETKGFFRLVFFGIMRLFFENFRILSKGTPLHFLKFCKYPFANFKTSQMFQIRF